MAGIIQCSALFWAFIIDTNTTPTLKFFFISRHLFCFFLCISNATTITEGPNVLLHSLTLVDLLEVGALLGPPFVFESNCTNATCWRFKQKIFLYWKIKWQITLYCFSTHKSRQGHYTHNRMQEQIFSVNSLYGISKVLYTKRVARDIFQVHILSYGHVC